MPSQQAQPTTMGATPLPNHLQAAQAKKTPERERVQTKLDFCTALANLGLGNFEKAANGLLRLSNKGLDDWFGKVHTLVGSQRDS